MFYHPQPWRARPNVLDVPLTRKSTRLARMTVNFIAPFPREECLRRLRATVQKDSGPVVSGFGIGGSTWIARKSGVVGKIGDTKLCLRKSLSGQINNSSQINNSFQTYLFGQLKDDGGQTRLKCRLGMHPFVIAFLVFWFGISMFLIHFSRSSSLLNVFGERHVVAFLLLGSLGSALLIFGRYRARGEEKFFIDFLRRTIDVREAE